jgi:hypothetical protein
MEPRSAFLADRDKLALAVCGRKTLRLGSAVPTHRESLKLGSPSA